MFLLHPQPLGTSVGSSLSAGLAQYFFSFVFYPPFLEGWVKGSPQGMKSCLKEWEWMGMGVDAGRRGLEKLPVVYPHGPMPPRLTASWVSRLAFGSFPRAAVPIPWFGPFLLSPLHRVEARLIYLRLSHAHMPACARIHNTLRPVSLSLLSICLGGLAQHYHANCYGSALPRPLL